LEKHAEKANNHICIEEAKVTANISCFHHHKFQEVIEIERRSNNPNSDDKWII